MSEQTQPTYEELRKCNALLVDENRELSQRVERLEEDLSSVLTQFRELKRHVFGRKSEKLSIIGEGQQPLFEAALPELEHEPEVEVSSHKRAARNGRKPLPAELPRERVEYEPEAQICTCCGAALEKIGEESSEELEYTPARFFVREHVKIKRACSKCKNSVQTGKLPADAQVIEKGRVGVGFLVYFHYSKSRAGKTAMELFSNYKGFVHTDCYAGYNPVFLPDGCQRVGCWAHVRRKFIEVQKLSKRDVDRVLK